MKPLVIPFILKFFVADIQQKKHIKEKSLFYF